MWHVVALLVTNHAMTPLAVTWTRAACPTTGRRNFECMPVRVRGLAAASQTIGPMKYENLIQSIRPKSEIFGTGLA